MDWLFSDAYLAAFAGALGGIVLGLAARLGRFCTLGAIEDYLYGGSDHRLRMWGVAIGVALIGAFGMMGAGWLDPAENAYLASYWNPAAHIVGGLIFGVGMALAGNCGFGALARLGGGDLRAFVIVLVMGISAYVVMSGPLAPLRLAVFPPDLIATDGPAGYAHILSQATGLSPALPGFAAGVTVLALALARPEFRAQPKSIAWGAAVGLAVVFGWGASAWLAHYTMGAVTLQSYTFAAPIGESILYAMTASGTGITFGVGAVAGVWMGAFAGSLMKGHFRWEACEDPRELRRQIFGAILMGGGAILSFGCTVGQGITGISVLALGAPLTLIGIFIGVTLGLRGMIVGFNTS